MLTPRRRAQLAIAAASITLVSTFTILVAGSAGNPQSTKTPAASGNSRIAPLATEQLGMTTSDDSSRLTLAR